jgi:type IV secretion system protein VirD4
MSDVLNDFAQPEPDAVPVLALCDEYRSTLANMSLMTEALSYSAGLGLQLCPIWQDANQIVDATSSNSWQTMLANCGVQVFFAPRDNFTASYVSDALGETEVIATSKTVNYPAATDWDKTATIRPQVSEQRGQVARRLLLPQEVRRLSRDEMVVLAEDLPDPFIGFRRSYRDTPEFKGLYGPNPFHPDAGVKAPGPGWSKRSKSFLFGSGRKG